MNITRCIDYYSMSHQASSLLVAQMEKNSRLLLCAATGNSPAGLYQELAAKARSDRRFFDRMRVIKLDEWGGLPENHQVTCEAYLRKKLLGPLEIPLDRFISFHSDPEDPREECNRIQHLLDNKGPIDLCILGIGINGHLGLNEPGTSLEPHCHVATLSEESFQHSMVRSAEIKPEYGLTLGMVDILSSRKIILLITGEKKNHVARRLLEGKISTAFPASLLWLHGDVECFIDKNTLV